MKKYFIQTSSGQEGPFSLEDLKEKKLDRTTQVWYKELKEWTTIDKIPELSELLENVPPPLPKNLETNQPPKFNTPNAKSEVKKRNNFSRLFYLVAVILIIFLCGKFGFEYYEDSIYKNNVKEEIRQNEYVRNNIRDFVIVERNEYTYREIGGISNLKISVSNNSDFLMDKVSVKVEYLKPNGIILETKNLTFKNIPSQKMLTLDVPDTERGTSIKYEIVSIESSALALY